jgi:hypothetical protein
MIKAITNNQITNHKLKIEEARGWRIEAITNLELEYWNLFVI